MSEPPIPASWLRRVASLSWWLGLGFALTFVYYAFRARFTVPYVDDWQWISAFAEAPFRTVWQPHNEHVVVIPRLVVWLDYVIWGWPGYASLIAAVLCHATIAGAFILTCGSRPKLEAQLLTGVVLVLGFLTYNLQGAVFPAASNFPLVAAFSTLAVACLCRPPARWSQGSAGHTAIAAALSVGAMLSLTNGLIIPFLLAALSWLLRFPRRTTMAFVALGVAGFLGRAALGHVGSTLFVGSLPAAARFALAMLAGPVAAIRPDVAVYVGVAVVALSTWVIWQFLRARQRQGDTAFLVGVLAFTIASAGMASMGRAQFDPSVAAESRYAALAATGWTALLLAVVPAGSLLRLPGSIAAAGLPVLAVLALPVQIFVGEVWAAKADHLATAGLTLAAQVDDRDWLWRMHPLGAAFIEPALPLLRHRDVPFLRFPQLGQTLPLAPTAPQCQGRVEALDPQPASHGLRLRGQLTERGHTLLVLDAASRVRGLARPAPLVENPRASANEFVWARLETLDGGRDAAGHWLGVAGRGVGPPFAAALVDENGGLICQVQVECCAPATEPAPRPELVIRGSMPHGVLDEADCNHITGWAWDPVRPAVPVDVRLVASNGRTLIVPARTFRQDLREAGVGMGTHGFLVRGGELGLGPGTWQVSASVAETGVALHGSPMAVTCSR